MNATAAHRPTDTRDRPRFAPRATDTFTAAVDAYLWGYPLVLMERTRKQLTHRWRHGATPVNTFYHRSRLETPRSRDVVKPNNDTLYSSAWLDLTHGPVTLDVPDVGDRYYSLQFLDAYTNTFAYVGSRTTGPAACSHLIVGPDGRHSRLPGRSDLPVVKAPTNTVWLLGRTLVDGESDLEAASELITRYRLTPAARSEDDAAWFTGPTPAPHDIGATGIAFYDELGAALTRNPPPAEETGLLERFATVGIGPGLQPSETSDAMTRLALDQSVTFAAGLLDARARKSARAKKNGTAGTGWTYELDLGTYGQDYLLRAIIARHGLGALTAEEAVYASTRRDAAGDRLHGDHAYRLRFAADRLPPVDAFWSLTAYDQDNFLVDNPIDRYTLGDRTAGLAYGNDGSLDILVQHHEPAEGTTNWLPVPADDFELTLRCYQPREEMLQGQYVLPAVQRR
ncbi:DUF1254 domain-containing protein [Streptomyces solisilvae]|uniref:DUF1254 domain-containing protein n=1 Tax=Streptomyces malaysiensis TaxID=92644 RepID=UPI003320F64A